MKILICGGAGSIGSHMVKLAMELEHDVVVVNNLSTGHEAAVGNLPLPISKTLSPALGPGIKSTKHFSRPSLRGMLE